MKQKKVKRVAVTGGAGQIAYTLLFQIASGAMLGEDQPVALHILELSSSLEALKGVVMELEDGAFPLLQEIRIGSDPFKVFQDVDYALLVGAKPRGPGMERKDLLSDNGKIFCEQGRALNQVAGPDIKVLVVGNPCNTNCLITMHHAPDIPKSRFFGMMALDQNRARALLAKRAGVAITEIDRVCVWGNHSATQVPDFFNATIQGKAVLDVIRDRAWCEQVWIPQVQKRGAAIIAARGKSSAASAAFAVVDTIRSILGHPSQKSFFSVATHSLGNPYGIDENLIFSFPTRHIGEKGLEIVTGLTLDPFLIQKMKESEKELLEERSQVAHYL